MSDRPSIPKEEFREIIDTEVWPMVMFLWGMGLTTFISCGGHKKAYGGANDKTSYGKFYVVFYLTDTMTLKAFADFLSEKAGTDTSLKVRKYSCSGSMARFSGKIKDFHNIFGNSMNRV